MRKLFIAVCCIAVVAGATAAGFSLYGLNSGRIHVFFGKAFDYSGLFGAAAYDKDYGKQTASSYDERLKKEAALSKNENLILSVFGSFDPLKGYPQGVAPKAKLSSEMTAAIDAINYGRAVYLVQFKSKIGTLDRETVEIGGAKIAAYVPNNAFLVYSPNADGVQKLSSYFNARFVKEFPSKLNVSPNIAAAAKKIAANGFVPLKLETYRGTKIAELSALLALFGESVVVVNAADRELEDYGTARVYVKKERLAEFLTAVSSVKIIAWTEFAPAPRALNSSSVWLLQCGSAALKTTPLFDAGITGAGQVYAAADSGLDTDACQFRYTGDAGAQTFTNSTQPPEVNVTNPDNKVIAYYTFSGAEAYDDQSGYFHGTMTTGCGAGDDYHHLATPDDPGLDPEDGMAPGAKIVFQDVANVKGEMYGLMTVSQTDMHKQAIGSGAHSHNNSYGLGSEEYGPFNNYDGDSREIDDIMWRNFGYMVVFASGNSGPDEGTLGGEGSTAKSTLAVGASFPGWSSMSDGDDMLSFSSRGPTDDGRLKPDLVAPGVIKSAVESECIQMPNIKDANGNTVCVSTTEPGNDNCASAMTAGTSFSSPIVAGITLLVRQYFTDGFYPSGKRSLIDGFEPTNALLKAVMINSTVNMRGDVIEIGRSATRLNKIPGRPETTQGWGRISLDDTLYLAGDNRDFKVFADVRNDSDEGAATGETKEYSIEVISSAYPLKVTLVWSDPAAYRGSRRILINDLDLVVVSPSGAAYKGNVKFADGVSTSADDTDVGDRVNPLENVFIENPEVGTWTIKVIGYNVPGGGQKLNPSSTYKQGFALVASGDFVADDPAQTADLSRIEPKMTGGCDNDSFLDLTETAALKVNVGNSGSGSTKEVSVEISLADGGDLDKSFVVSVGETKQNLGIISGKSGKKAEFKLRLREAAGSDACGKKINVNVVVKDGGQTVYDKPFEVVAHMDTNPYNGSSRCQNDVCKPGAVISSLTPNEANAGDTIQQIAVEGEHLPTHIAIKFEDDRIKVTGEIVSFGETFFTANAVVIPPEVPAGHYAIMVLDAADEYGEWSGLPNALQVNALPADGDEETRAEEEQTEPEQLEIAEELTDEPAETAEIIESVEGSDQAADGEKQITKMVYGGGCAGTDLVGFAFAAALAAILLAVRTGIILRKGR